MRSDETAVPNTGLRPVCPPALRVWRRLPANDGDHSSDHYVTLTWKASSEANYYNVYRSAISGGYYGLIGSTAELTFKDQDVTSGATYYYVCTAVDSAGRESSHSNEVEVTIP